MPLGRLAPKLRTPPPLAVTTKSTAKGEYSYAWLLGALYSATYLVFSTSIILANKHIITETHFNCPIAVSALGSLFGWTV
mmetsp:Transcript_20825/g.33752  ORF Transcript_20825/g.33752 Transcript_20825/m.33752 type:complete len:80 (-) Transcript_20825:19-258(-)